MAEIEIASDRFVCELSADAEPLIEVPPGSVLRIHCRSACDRDVGPGPVRAEAANPSTGPIAVAGAEPGHALKVEVLDIVPAPVGHISAAPLGGGEPRYREVPIRDGLAIFSDAARIPLAPMIGVLGTAPPEGSWSTMDCGFAGSGTDRSVIGGNMDTNDVAPGASVFLPVFRPGGLLVVGDVHAVMGDGEIGGQGLEVAAEVVLRVDIEERPLTGGVYLYRDDMLMTLGAAPTLDDACAMAARAMAGILERAGVADGFTAMKLLGLAGQVRVGELCCPTKTARVAVPLSLVPAPRP